MTNISSTQTMPDNKHGPIETSLFIDQVYDRLLESISFGELKPGERVRQSLLAERLGVSRQPISHALQLLKHQGLVRDVGKQGVEVAPVDPNYIVSLYEARSALEARAASLASMNVRNGTAPRALIKLLKSALAHGQLSCEQDAPLPVLVRADSQFHIAIYRLSGNPVIEEMMRGQWPHLMRSMIAVLDDPGVPTRAWEEHALLTDYILSGQTEQAAEMSASHMHRAGSDLHRRLSNLQQQG